MTAELGERDMAEPFFRLLEALVPAVAAANGNKITFHGLENIPSMAALCSRSTTPAMWTSALLHEVQEQYPHPKRA